MDNQVAQASQSVPLIRLRGITKSYQSGELTTQVLHGIDLDIQAGEFVAIVGSSGSGKSTLMNILGCLDKPTEGDYEFRGRAVSALDHDELAALRRDAFGFVFQNYNLLAAADAVANVELPAVYSGRPATERRERAKALLSQLGLAERLDHKPGQLSGGQQQRVSIARALMNGGDIILADEPTGALDSQSGKDVMALLAELSRQGHTIILITHDPKVAAHADRLIEIKDGHIVADNKREDAVVVAEPKVTPARGKGNVLNDLGEAFATAARSLKANVFRTMLTLLGIVIGVASVISMLAIGQGAQQEVVDRISAMGSNLLSVFPGAPNQRGRWNVATLVPEDADAINELPNVLAAVPELTGSQTLRRAGFDQQTQVNATYATYPMARNWFPQQGSFFTQEDEEMTNTVAVIGHTVARQMFPDRDPLGEFLLINNVLFRVIGVMQERGASPWGQDQDDVVLVPFSTGSLRLFGQRFVRNITIAVDNTQLMHQTHQEVHNLLLERHGVEDFTIRNMASIIETQTETENTMTVLLGVIAVISLVVGGIGVMNIMLVSVTERTREIGVRMATGARRLHIMQQFLIEALTVSLLGGVLGVAIGLGATALIERLGTPVLYATAPVVLAFACAFLTGLIFGFLPARKASRLDPVQALSSE
ncbi:MacB family efflux pump subunit [Aliidiomarina maris]|uniref:Pyoverdine export ATP-binding/permease protein PvdT n=1 Tax=Aliidiomarina maris TaxID=531312 RepID=A0A327X0B8_9GAMM|nr:MacB family efflux pump subunit [Aliidiomarina maris]MCL5051274.1 MacB family efflux pump subunit [Bacillota bacterium]RAJ99231.1 macrolide transport system ATP-binding/permease protein [Aliidiomarina maris]